MRAAILVGGQARRMGGRAKGLLKVDGEPLVLRLAALLSALGAVQLIGDPLGPYGGLGLPVIPDDLSEDGIDGAPAGVLTALRNGPEGWVFVCALDLPNLDDATVRWICAARQPEDRAVLPQADGHLQPLAGLWHASAANTYEAGMSLKGWARAVKARVLLAPDSAPFTNLNTPEDLARYRALAKPS